MKTYKLINYFDVWGNEEDGFEVNNCCAEFDDLIIAESAIDNDIIDYLYNIGFLNNNDYTKFTVESFDADFIEIFASENMYPICRLEAN